MNPAETYAWNWFSLHAGHRMQMINFWLVATAFLGAALVQAQINDLDGVSAAICLLGVLFSLGFWRMDVRTRQLIQVAEVALAEAERRWLASGESDLSALTVRAHDFPGRRWCDSYRVVIQGMQVVAAGIFAVAAIYVAST